MATARNPHSMMTNPRGNAELTDDSRPRTISGNTNDLRRWPIFSALSPNFLESVRLYYVFEQPIRWSNGQSNGSKTFFVTQDDEVWAMGNNNDQGCMGTGNYDPCFTPVKVAALSGKDVQSFAHGWEHVLALTRKGEVYAWGNNKYFQVGKADLEKILIPALMYGGGDPALEIACGGHHSACRTKKGDVYCWGWNEYGQIGTGNKKNQGTPRRVLGPIADLKCTGISCQLYATVAVFENGEVYVWGNNCDGELGIGLRGSCLVPLKVDVESNMIKKVASGDFNTLALAANGSLYVWGDNSHGQLGLHCEDTQGKPIRHSGLRESHGRIIDITACRNMSAAMTDDFKVLVWGSTKEGDLRSPIEVPGESLQDAFAKMAPEFVTPVPVVRTPKSVLSTTTALQDTFAKMAPISVTPVPAVRIPASVISTTTALVAQDPSSLTDWGRNWLNTLIEQFDNSAFSDVEFRVQNKIIHAHKVLLIFQSEYFRKMFQGPWRDIGSDTIEVTESSYPVYKAFVRYFYTGDVDVEVSDALELLQLAAPCSEDALTRKCKRRIEEMISVENWARVYLVSVRSGHTELEESCMRFAMDHLTAVTRTSAFAALPHDILPRFLSGVAERGAFKT